MIRRRHAIDRVVRRERGRGGGPECRHRPAAVGDPAHASALTLAGEDDERDIARASRIRAIPPRHGNGLRVDLLHVGGSRHPELALSTAPTEDKRRVVADISRHLGPLGVGDDPLDLPELGLARDVAVGAHHHRHRAEPADRDGERERARPGPHQHAHVLPLPHPDPDQTAHHVVDPLVDVPRRVGAVFEQEENLVGCPPPAFLDEQPEGDPRPRLDLLEPHEAGELSDRVACQLACRPRRAARRRRDGAGDPGADARRELEPVADPATYLAGQLERRVGRKWRDLVRLFSLSIAPARPCGNRRPAQPACHRSHH